MFFRIETANGLAIYEQIVRQVKFAVAGEALKAGDWSPPSASCRASWPSTPTPSPARIASCRHRDSRPGPRHRARSHRARRADIARAERVKLIRERLRSVLLEARRSRLEPDEIRTLIDEELDRLDKKGKAS